VAGSNAVLSVSGSSPAGKSWPNLRPGSAIGAQGRIGRERDVDLRVLASVGHHQIAMHIGQPVLRDRAACSRKRNVIAAR
jgi:hypothetical protein